MSDHDKLRAAILAWLSGVATEDSDDPEVREGIAVGNECVAVLKQLETLSLERRQLMQQIDEAEFGVREDFARNGRLSLEQAAQNSSLTRRGAELNRENEAALAELDRLKARLRQLAVIPPVPSGKPS